MKYRTILLALMITAGIFLLVQPLHAQEQVQQEIIYQTSFSTDPHLDHEQPPFILLGPSRKGSTIIISSLARDRMPTSRLIMTRALSLLNMT
jgi:hypothetical protein